MDVLSRSESTDGEEEVTMVGPGHKRVLITSQDDWGEGTRSERETR